MTRQEIIYFGSTFVLLGCGMGVLSMADSAPDSTPVEWHDPQEDDFEQDE